VFGREIGKSRRMVEYYLSGERVPQDIQTILDALFRDDPLLATAREGLIVAFWASWGAVPKSTGPAKPGSVPWPTEHFLGRDDDVAAVLEALLGDGSSAILLQGGPGIGKTSLTQAVAHHPDCVARFRDARIFVQLETATTAGAMGDAIVRALGGEPARGLEAALAAWAGKPLLLILDNLETPWDPTPERLAVEEMLAALARAPDLTIMGSFRGVERVRGPAWTLTRQVLELAPHSAAELFDRIASWPASADPAFPNFRIALGGLPLAIELVARRAYGRTTLGGLWTEWSKLGADLATHPDFADGRLTSLPHSIELSLRGSRVTAAAWRLFRLLGQLPAGLCSEDRDALLGDSADGQDRLLRVGLALERADRVELLPPVREYAVRRHTPDPDAVAWVEHFLELAGRRGKTITTPAGDGAFARLLPEIPNIEAAVRRTIATDRRDLTMRVLLGLSQLLQMAAVPTPILGELASACRSANDAQGEAICLWNQGVIARARSNLSDAEDALDRALLLFRQAKNVIGEADCIRHKGDIAVLRSEFALGQEAYEQALELDRGVNNLHGEADSLRGLGDIAHYRADEDAAQGAYQRALPLFRQVGDVLGEANCVAALARVALALSDDAGAEQNFLLALTLYRGIGEALGEANCILGLGTVASRRADLSAAQAGYEAALPLFREIGDVIGEANCACGLAEVALARSDPDASWDAYERAQQLYRKLGSVRGEGGCLLGFGDVARHRGDAGEARKFWEMALAIFERLGVGDGVALCQTRLDHP
jgi:tetratricopeptide (TPR) repeat protein